MVTQASIQAFLDARRIAVVGVSRDPASYSRRLFTALRGNGYEAIPVHPSAERIDGVPCIRSVKDIQPPPDRAILLLPEDQTARTVIACGEAGIRKIWLHRRIGMPLSDAQAVFHAERLGIELITGACLFMFLPRTGAIHRLHKTFLGWMGVLPA